MNVKRERCEHDRKEKEERQKKKKNRGEREKGSKRDGDGAWRGAARAGVALESVRGGVCTETWYRELGAVVESFIVRGTDWCARAGRG